MQTQSEFIEIIKLNEGIIYKIALFYAVNKEDQQDLYQEIVYQLWKSFDNFRGDAKLSTWMYKIALNTAITFFKNEKKKGKTIAFNNKLFDKIDYKDNLTENRIKLLHNQIEELNKVEKGIILLFLEGKTYDEISKITGFTASNVGTRLARIKQKLKSRIKK